MIALPPGCTVNYAITIELSEMTADIANWYRLVGGSIREDVYYDHRGKERNIVYVQYGKGKPCHYRQDGSNGVRLHFDGADAPVASMFLIKFLELVETHNLQEHMERMHYDENRVIR